MNVAPDPVEVIRAEALAGLPHGFLGRRGGVSTGIHAGLNVGLGSNDDRDAVHENRRRAVAAVKPGAKLATVHQIHSAIAVVAEAFPDDARPHADALVTDRPDLLLGVLAADCVPILFADAQAGVVGAAHSGWKGSIGGVSLATIEAMERLGADRGRIAAAVGPCIGRASYEVDDGFLARFVAEDPENERFSSPGAPATTSSTSRPMWSRASRRRGCGASRHSASTPTRLTTASSAIAARRIAASRDTGGRSR